MLARYSRRQIIIELKVNSAELAAAVVGDVRRADAVERVCLGAFGRRVLRAARALEPRDRHQRGARGSALALYRSWVRWPVRRAPYGGYQVPESAGRTRVVSPRFVDDAHARRSRRAGVDRRPEADARRLLAWGVDALITDRPDIMVPLVRSFAGSTRQTPPPR